MRTNPILDLAILPSGNNPDTAEQLARRAARSLWSVAAGGLLFLLGVGLSAPSPGRAAGMGAVAAPAPEAGAASGGLSQPAVPYDAASAEELRQNWPRFRGMDGGVSAVTNAPVSWDPTTGSNVLWKTPAPASGFGSPIVWGARVFFSGGDAIKREVDCLDARSGKVLWQQLVVDVPGSPTPVPEAPEGTGYAASTMATDGRRVYAFFGNGDLAALSMDGKLVWSKAFGAISNMYGHAASLATWRDRLFLQLDQGAEEDGKSMLYALDGQTGKVVWQRPRKVGSSWVSPIVIQAAGKAQIITLAVPWVMAYAPEDGAELWRADCLNDEVVPSPVFAGGLVMAAHPSQELVAIRPDGQGDVTKSGVVWRANENTPDIPSPVSNGELVFTVTSAGMLTCFDARTGAKQWEHNFDIGFRASPAMAGNRLYLFGEKGIAIVAGAGRGQFQEFFRADMDDAFDASPAFVDGRIFLRGRKFVWCLGSATTSLSVAGAAKSADVSAGTAPVLEKINPKDGAAMVYVPAGEFLMGSKEGEGCDWERPQRKVTLDGFYIYKYDVTVAQYRQFCAETKRAMPPEPNWKWQDNHPIVNVTWHDAAAYATWAGVKLPTEAQWEKAARGTDARVYSWGNRWAENTSIHSAGKTAPVGSCPAGTSPYGAFDLVGNVWQWCADWYDADYYATAPLVNPPGPATGTTRVLRGGSWGFNMPEYFRASYRNRCTPECKYPDYGFRCAYAEPPAKP
jgi:formylglycine-generating enzyme required for sulfatase activity